MLGHPLMNLTSVGTWEKCHCNQIVTVSRGSLLTNQSFGKCKNCHCNRFVTVTGVTITDRLCTIIPYLADILKVSLSSCSSPLGGEMRTRPPLQVDANAKSNNSNGDQEDIWQPSPFAILQQGCQMAIAKFLDCIYVFGP